MAGRFGRDHRDIDVGRGLDHSEMNAEAVGEHQRLAGSQVRRNVLLIEIALNVIGREDHDHLGLLCRFGGVENLQAGGFRFGAALASRRQADNYLKSGIAQVQCMRVALAAVADDGDLPTFERLGVSILFVKAFWHRYLDP